MNTVQEFSVPPEALSCLVGNLFAELEPPCAARWDPEALTLCGRTAAGRDAMLMVYRERCLFAGDLADLEAARRGRCPDRRCGHGG